MALGIGSCVAVFSMIAAVLLVEWPYTAADRLAIVWHARANTPGVIGMSPSDVEVYRASLRSFDGIAAVTTRGYNAGATNPFRLTCARITPGMLPMLGVAAQRGRWFTDDEDRRREAVVLISERMWRAQLGADSAYPGRDLLLDAIPHRVIGIMPASFAFPPEGVQGLQPADCWVPASYTAAELTVPGFNFVLFGRIKSGATLAQAAADANAGALRIWSSYPAAVQSQITLEARVVPLIDQALAGSQTPLYLFAAAALLLLLIGCSNVANLLLTSLDIRRRELAVRSSLGASRATLIAQLLMESIALAIAGGLAGAALASGLLSALVAVNADAFPRLAAARVDLSALGFAIVCSTIAGLLGGLAPAWQLGASPHAAVVTERAGSRGFSRQWWRRGLIAFEVALAMLVLVLASALARSVATLNAIEPGFSPRGLVAFSVALPASQYARPEQTTSFATEIVRRLSDMPGVLHAAAGSALPIGGAAPAVIVPTTESSATPKYQPALLYAVTSDYARVAGIRLREGRFVEPSDGSSTTAVAVINETLERSIAPVGQAIGRSIMRVGSPSPLTIVGVVGDVRQAGPLRPAAPAVYVPMAQLAQPVTTLNFAVRSEMRPERLATQVREVVSSLDETLPTFALRTGNDLIAATVTSQRFNLLVLGVFAIVAISLAIAGVYGVLSHFVQQSRRGFGIRQALGATTARIVVSVTSWAMAPVAIGVIAGGVAATAAVTFITSLLFGVSPNDPLTLLGVAAVVTIVAVIAVLPTAVRASRSDIAALLRQG
jgi:putative ABC transport system permease protein